MQWVRPSLQWLQQLFLASGQDPDYRPSQLYSLLQVWAASLSIHTQHGYMERVIASDSQQRGQETRIST
jgi:hypothetical protein